MNYREFKKKYNIILNPQQESAVVQVEGQTLVLAIPGSGKTTVIVSRLGYMLLCCNIPSGNILTMTYNVSAAADMKNRFISKFGVQNTGRLEFRTINGFCATVIMYYERIKHTHAFALMQETQSTKIIRAIYVNMTNEFPSESTIRDIKTKLVFARNMMLREEEIKKIKVGEINFFDFFTAYKQYKYQNKIMDYDDQLEFALRILVSNPDILAYYQNRYRYINVDEAQDTSKIQHMIIRLLAGRYKNIFMVGDEDQSIYGFRAAYPQALLQFSTVYPDSKVLLMEKNYRSTTDIVDKANRFIKLNKCRHDKNMCTDSTLCIPVKNIVLKDYKYQYNYILKMISDSDDELAILYRNNDCALPIIDLLEKNNIGYRLKENDGLFFSTNTILDIVAILRFSFDQSNAELFCDFYYKVGLRIKKNIIEDAARIHRHSDLCFIDTLCSHPAVEKWQIKKLIELRKSFAHLRRLGSYSAITYILGHMEYSDYIKKHGFDESKVKTLLSIANQNPELPVFLERIISLRQIVLNGSSDPDSRIILSTIHSSKGLEYDNVLMIDVRNGLFPSVEISEDDEKSVPKEMSDALEEERRLFYVGATRAKNTLTLFSYEAAYGVKCEPSSFTDSFLGIAPQKKTPQKQKTAENMIKDAPTAKKTEKNRFSKNEILKMYKKGTRICHSTYGNGIITSISFPQCKVSIDGTGDERSFDISFCINNNIISVI
ncbi:MAG: ATP-dependent helicase [Oscillospiraceae bacterium]|nr:ATP-dependent helicase [Oscillospiraceae bacterium]